MKIDWDERIVWFRTGKDERTGIYFEDIGKEIILPLCIYLTISIYIVLSIAAIIVALIKFAKV